MISGFDFIQMIFIILIIYFTAILIYSIRFLYKKEYIIYQKNPFTSKQAQLSIYDEWKKIIEKNYIDLTELVKNSNSYKELELPQEIICAEIKSNFNNLPIINSKEIMTYIYLVKAINNFTIIENELPVLFRTLLYCKERGTANELALLEILNDKIKNLDNLKDSKDIIEKAIKQMKHYK